MLLEGLAHLHSAPILLASFIASPDCASASVWKTL